MGKHYETIRLQRLLHAFYETLLNLMLESITFPTISCFVLVHLRIMTFPVREMHFEEAQKRKRRILINNIVYGDFCNAFREMAPD